VALAALDYVWSNIVVDRRRFLFDAFASVHTGGFANSTLLNLLIRSLFNIFPVAPALIIVGPVLLTERSTRSDPNRVMSNWFLYAASLAGLVAEYLWLGEMGQH
jgi:hypothetical protein